MLREINQMRRSIAYFSHCERNIYMYRHTYIYVCVYVFYVYMYVNTQSLMSTADTKAEVRIRESSRIISSGSKG